MYSLENRFLAEEIVNKHEETHEERYKNRKAKLEHQLKQGK